MTRWENWVKKEVDHREANSIQHEESDYNAGAAAMMQIVKNELVPLINDEVQRLLEKNDQLSTYEEKARSAWENTLEKLSSAEKHVGELEVHLARARNDNADQEVRLTRVLENNRLKLKDAEERLARQASTIRSLLKAEQVTATPADYVRFPGLNG